MDKDEVRRQIVRELLNEKAQRECKDLLARANDRDEPLTEADSYAEEVVTGKKYLLAGNGPTVWFYIVYDTNGQEEFGVVEYNDMDGSGYAIVPQHEAEVIELALRRR